MNDAEHVSARVLIGLVIAMTVSSVATTSIYVPSVPGMARDLGAPLAEVQWTLTFYMAVYALAQLVLGPVSDRHGRRPVLLGGLALSCAAAIACAAAPTVGWLLAARSVQGVGACVGVVVSRSLLRDVYGRQGSARALSSATVAVSIAPILAPAIGGWIDALFGWRATFVFLAVLVAGVWTASAVALPETNPPRAGAPRVSPAATLATYAGLLGSRGFLGFALTNAAIYFTLYAYVAGAPVVLIVLLGVSPEDYGPLQGMPMLGFFVGAMLATRLNARWRLDGVVDVGVGAIAAVGVIQLGTELAGWTGPAALVASLVAWGVGMGLVQPSAIAGAVSVTPRTAGAAAALIGCLQYLGAAAGTLSASLLPKTSAGALFVLLGAAGLATAASWALLRRAARATG